MAAIVWGVGVLCGAPSIELMSRVFKFVHALIHFAILAIFFSRFHLVLVVSVIYETLFYNMKSIYCWVFYGRKFLFS